MPDERASRSDRVSPLEAALRGFADRKTDEVLAPDAGVTFDSLNEAYDFYNLYSWECGFGIRYGKSRSNVKGSRSMQEFLCNCSVGLPTPKTLLVQPRPVYLIQMPDTLIFLVATITAPGQAYQREQFIVQNRVCSHDKVVKNRRQ
jgi:hypothetical protein